MRVRRWFPRSTTGLLGSLVVVLTIAVNDALACPVCFSGRVTTPGQRLDAADRAVLALPTAEAARFRVVEVIKGNAEANAIIAEPAPLTGATLQDGKPHLLLHNPIGDQWLILGAIGVEHAAWLRRLAATGDGLRGRWRGPLRPMLPQASELTDDQWRERLALVVPYLESQEPLAAEIAYGELSRAPYAALRLLKPQLDASTVAGWLDNPTLAARHPAYLVLLGIAGGPGDAARLEQRIEGAWAARDATNLGAMLTANLEMRGATRVGWIEQNYFADQDRTMPEVEAALLALSVHGRANATIPRKRVVDAYRFFIKVRKPMAGFVAMELADWEHWDATPDYVALLKSGAIKDPASVFAVVSYLQRSPRSDAKAALQLPPVRSE